MAWVYLAQAMNILFPQKVGNFLTVWAVLSYRENFCSKQLNRF
jgi:hypothetical protein